MVVFKARAALAACAWACAWAGARAQVPCSVAKEVAPGEVRRFHFQRAGAAQDLLCVFTFHTQLGAPLALLLDALSFGNMTERDCECGELRMYDVSPSGELVSKVRRCAGEDADGAELLASDSVVLLTLSTHACPGPALAFTVGPPGALGLSTNATTTTSTTTTTTTTTTRSTMRAPTSEPAPTRAPASRRTTTTTTARPTRRARQLNASTAATTAAAADDADSDSTVATTTKSSRRWWRG